MIALLLLVGFVGALAWALLYGLAIAPRVWRAVRRFAFYRRLRDGLPLSPGGFTFEDGVGAGSLDDLMIIGAGLARNTRDARALLDQHGGDVWRVIRCVPVRYRRRAPWPVRVARALRRIAFGV